MRQTALLIIVAFSFLLSLGPNAVAQHVPPGTPPDAVVPDEVGGEGHEKVHDDAHDQGVKNDHAGHGEHGHHGPAYHAGDHGLGKDQYAVFPRPLASYEDPEGAGLLTVLKARAAAEPFNLWATGIFLCAILHTFLAPIFLKIAHRIEHVHHERIRKLGLTGDQKPYEEAEDHQNFWFHFFEFLGEVEAVFGLWVLALMGAAIWFFGGSDGDFFGGLHQFVAYMGHDVNFVEPIFVVVIMAIAATRPVIQFAERTIGLAAKLLGDTPEAWWVSVLTIAPLLGSFITEPAAMTIAALLLAQKFFMLRPAMTFRYATLGLLFVNVSVGGTLTHFAAPPVLMVANKWGWDMSFMFQNFGWKAAMGIILANAFYYAIFRGELKRLFRMADMADGISDGVIHWKDRKDPVPFGVVLVHLGALAWTVGFAHYPPMFIGGFLFLLAFRQATAHHQNPIELRTPILVGFFLAGLVIHGRCQSWWIEPVLMSGLPPWGLMLGAALLTAFNDNAAITFLASQVPGMSAISKVAVMNGAVGGGGLTVIANAPNPAGQSILKGFFGGAVQFPKLMLGALIPTAIVLACLWFLPAL